MVENLWDYWKIKPVLNVKQVALGKPKEGRIKINMDRSYIKENGWAGIGGVIRDSNEDFISAFSKSVTCTGNNEAEALAAKFGTQWGIASVFNNFNMGWDWLSPICWSRMTYQIVDWKRSYLILTTISGMQMLASPTVSEKPTKWQTFLLNWHLLVELKPTTFL